MVLSSYNFTVITCELKRECDVQVYEGWNTSGRVLLRANGSSIPNWINLDSGSQMLVNFMSNGSVDATGFRAHFGVRTIIYVQNR